jgi:hypothetical protein
MIPTIDERVASIVRALTDVVLPSLPPEAGLAMEQVQLSIGQLQIIRAQLDAAPAFETEELSDAMAIGKALGGLAGGADTKRALSALDASVSAAGQAAAPADIRDARDAIHEAVTAVIGAVAADGDDASRSAIGKIILDHERPRVLKDRRWSAPFGFDTVPA